MAKAMGVEKLSGERFLDFEDYDNKAYVCNQQAGGFLQVFG